MREEYVGTLAVLFFAYIVRGITGFGSGLISVPLLAHWLPLQFIVPFVLALDYVAALALGGKMRADVDWREIRILLPFSAVGAVLGIAMLNSLPHRPLLMVLGAFVAAIGWRTVFNIHGERQVSRYWAIPTGVAGGAVQAVFSTGGPLYVIYLSHRLAEKGRLRATYSGFFAFDGALRLLMFLATGMLTQAGLPSLFLAALPVMAAGLYLGHRVLLGLSGRQAMQVVGCLLLGSGASLLWKSCG